MHVEITSRKIPLTPTVRNFIQAHITEYLSRFAARIASIHVELRDKNGRRGGGDKRCRIRIELPDRVQVLAEDMRANTRAAIRHAMGRAAAEVRATLRRAKPQTA